MARRNSKKVLPQGPRPYSASHPNTSLPDPFRSSTNSQPGSVPKLFDQKPKTGQNSPRLISDLRNIVSSPVSSSVSIEARDSPTFQALERTKTKKRNKGHRVLHDSASTSTTTLPEYGDLEEVVDSSRPAAKQEQHNASLNELASTALMTDCSDLDSDSSESSSDSEVDATSKPSEKQSSKKMELQAGRHVFDKAFHSPLKRVYSTEDDDRIVKRRRENNPDNDTSSEANSSESSDSEDSSSSGCSDDDAIDRTSTQPPVKRVKPNTSAPRQSSTVSSRNPPPPHVIKPETTDSSPVEGGTSRIAPNYPKEVLQAAHALEAVMPPYLTPALTSQPDKRQEYQPLRPPAGSDDTTRLVTLLKSARTLIFQLSLKKLTENETDVHAQMLRIAKEREVLLRITEGEVKRLLAVAQSKRRR